MKETRAQEIFDCIKRDDVKAITKFFQERKANLSFCYGRFPVLSLAYLYRSRKIINAFERELAAVSPYVFVEEPKEAYEKFRGYAKRSLRFYTKPDCIVEPVEILAIIGDEDCLESSCAILRQDSGTKDRLKKIFDLSHDGRAALSERGLEIKRKSLSIYHKITLSVIPVLAVLMIIFSSLILPLISLKFGLGTADNPIKITNSRQLKAATGDLRYELSQDVILPSDWEPLNFKGFLDGKGHTIMLGGSENSNVFISELSGSIIRTTFILDNIDTEISENRAFICLKNNGVIEYSTLKISGIIKENTVDDIYLAGFSTENNGGITGCTLDINLTLSGGGDGNAYFGGFAGINNGTIVNCRTMQDSVISADTFDLGGIAAENNTGALIEECVNNAKLSQTTDSVMWSPNTAGIVTINAGTVKDSANYGELNAASFAVEAGVYNEIYAGGIACSNIGLIEKCKNDAELNTTTSQFYIYTGGIAALNSGVIKDCGAFGQNTVTAPETDNIFAFAGGVIGYAAAGEISVSFSACTFGHQNPHVFTGGVIGMSRGYISGLSFVTRITSVNNYYIGHDNIDLGISRIYLEQNNRNPYAFSEIFSNPSEVLTNFFTIFEKVDLNELKNTEVYWE